MRIVKILEWDTNFFRFPVAQIQSSIIDDNNLNEVLEFCKKRRVRLLQFKCDAHHRESILLSEKGKFHFVDVRLTLSKKLSKFDNTMNCIPPDLSFRKAEVSDISALKAIVTDLYTHSRYYFDTNFPRDDVHGFYQNWIEKSVHGRFDDLVWVLYKDQTPVGCCSVSYESKQSASIGLFGIDPTFGGKGFGVKLLESVLISLQENNFNMVKVVTQGRNIEAQRLYQRMGFRNEKMKIYYHRWFDW